MPGLRKNIASAFWAITTLALLGALAMVIGYTPEERTIGVVQKIFYVHMPLAVYALLGAMLVFVASIGYLASRRTWWDDLATAGAGVTVLLGTGVLATGMIWGKSAWGVWWAWTPRLTFSLMLWLLYIVYLMLRSSMDSPQRRAVVSAVYGTCAFLDVPLVWLSARLIPDPIHPPTVELSGPMKLTLLVWLLAIGMLVVGLVVVRYRLNRQVRELEKPRQNEIRGIVGARTSRGIA